MTAGTFDTMRHEGYAIGTNGVERAIVWTSMEHRVTVRQQTLGDNGEVIGTIELVSLK